MLTSVIGTLIKDLKWLILIKVSVIEKFDIKKIVT